MWLRSETHRNRPLNDRHGIDGKISLRWREVGFAEASHVAIARILFLMESLLHVSEALEVHFGLEFLGSPHLGDDFRCSQVS
jgi:hypothetical protein